MSKPTCLGLSLGLHGYYARKGKQEKLTALYYPLLKKIATVSLVLYKTVFIVGVHLESYCITITVFQRLNCRA